MSRLICSLPALHELVIGSGSSKITDKLTGKVLKQAVCQTWKVLRVESSSPDILYAFVSSQKLIKLDSLHLIHRPSGNMVSTYLYSTHCMYVDQYIGTVFYPSMWSMHTLSTLRFVHSFYYENVFGNICIGRVFYL